MHTLCIIHGDATLDMIERKKNGIRSVYYPQCTASWYTKVYEVI